MSRADFPKTFPKRVRDELRELQGQGKIAPGGLSQAGLDLLSERLLEKFPEYSSYSLAAFSAGVRDSAMATLQSEPTPIKRSIGMSGVTNFAVGMDSNNFIQRNLLKQEGKQEVSKRARVFNSNGEEVPLSGDAKDAKLEDILADKEDKKKNRPSPRGSTRNRADGWDPTNPDGSGLAFLAPTPNVKLSNLAGIEPVLKQIEELVFFPARYPWMYRHLGVRPPCGFLVYGPSGCGKSSLAMGIAGELPNFKFFKATGTELLGGNSGETEDRIKEIFDAAMRNSPSILYIDSIDIIAGKKEGSSQRGAERRVIAQLLDCFDNILNFGMDQSSGNSNDAAGNTSMDTSDAVIADGESGQQSPKEKEKDKLVIFVATTNKPDQLDPAVRGRFSREISVPVPDAAARSKILQLQTSNMRLNTDVDFESLGKLTPGFVGSDLLALTREAGMRAVSRHIREEVSESEDNKAPEDSSDVSTINKSAAPDKSHMFVDMDDFVKAAKAVQPTAKREGFAVVPNVTWNDVGALAEVREELLHNVLEPIANPDKFKALGLEIPAGVLFYGPPGCGKTLLAKAIANQSGANFISVKGPELLNMFVGESESRVREVFTRARGSAPCVIFFDELDALCPKRGSGTEGSNVTERVVNQLLTEIDGLEARKDVYIIAATNRLELIDDAMLRPGRLGKLLYVPLPNPDDRCSILRALVKNINIKYGENGVDLDKIAKDSRADGFSGADMAALVREAGIAVVKEWHDESKQQTESGASVNYQNKDTALHPRHFEKAFEKVKPSVSVEDRRRFDRVYHNLKSGMGAIQALREAQLKSGPNR